MRNVVMRGLDPRIHLLAKDQRRGGILDPAQGVEMLILTVVCIDEAE
jgi:hypothetical protein